VGALQTLRSSSRTWVLWCTSCRWTDAAPAPASATHSSRPAAVQGSHGVHLYRDGQDLATSLEAHLVRAWAAGGTGVVIGTPEHRSALLGRLAARGHLGWLDEGRLVELDAAQTLSGFMRNGSPDPHRFEKTVGSVIRQLAERPPLHAFGEMVDLLWVQGEPAAALELEGLWRALQDEVPFSLLCAYGAAGVDRSGRVRIAAAHDHLVR
jgi:hypothetical protein